MTETATTTYPAPGSPAPGAPPALRRDGGVQVAATSAGTAARPTDTPAVSAAPATPDLGAARLVAALAGTAVGLWLERRWRR